MNGALALGGADRGRATSGAEAGAVDLGAALVAGIVRERAGLGVIAPQWQGLERRAEGAMLFQSLGWAQAVFDFEAARGNADFDPVIATLSQGRRLMAILPLERISEKGLTVLAPLGHAFGQYADAMVAPEIGKAEAVRRLIRAALIAAHCDIVRFLKVRDGSALALGLPDTRIATGAEQGAPQVDLGAFADFAAYFQTIKTKTRKNMRNARNRLEREGALTHVIADSAGERLDIIERSLAGRAERLKDLGLTSRAFRDDGFATFCKGLVARPDIEVAAFSLRHDGKPIAEQWGFVHEGRYYAFVATRDFSNSDESPGKLHLGEVLKACAERGIGGCDLGVPVMPYKLTWATETVAVRDYALPVTPQGLAFVILWDMTLRPILKRLVLAMPRRLRLRLMKIAGYAG